MSYAYRDATGFRWHGFMVCFSRDLKFRISALEVLKKLMNSSNDEQQARSINALTPVWPQAL